MTQTNSSLAFKGEHPVSLYQGLKVQRYHLESNPGPLRCNATVENLLILGPGVLLMYVLTIFTTQILLQNII